MDKTTLEEDILNIGEGDILLELPTGTGKTKLALEILSRYCTGGILIVVPKLTIMKSWEKEIRKHGFDNMMSRIHFSTYISYPKYVDDIKSGIIEYTVFDECHHCTERVMFAYKQTECKGHHIFLSATVSQSIKDRIRAVSPMLQSYKLSVQTAIMENILPEPTVVLFPLTLDNTSPYVTYSRGKGAEVVTCQYWERRKYMYKKGITLHIKCTEKQYIDLLENNITFLSRFSSRSMALNKQYLLRLKMLSYFKTKVVKRIIDDVLKDRRVLTFCTDIQQSEYLSPNCVHSKNALHQQILDAFNAGEINQITAVAMLDEGVNLTNCQFGIYCAISSSDNRIAQRLGRILRHEHPVLIIPFYSDTREADIVFGEMLSTTDNVVYASNIQELKNVINKIT